MGGLYSKCGNVGDLKPKSGKIDAENKDLKLEEKDLMNTIVDLNSNNNNSTLKLLNSDSGSRRNEHDSDSDSLCVADKTSSSRTRVTNDSQQLSPSPPDLLLYDNDCQFSP